MKLAVGMRVKIVFSEDDMTEVGTTGVIKGVEFTRYTLTLDTDPSYVYYATEEGIAPVKNMLKSTMENYGRILMPLLHGSMDAPKMVYYSSTAKSVYMMDKMMNTSAYFEVCVVRMLWDRYLQDYSPDKLATETFHLKQPSNMADVLKAFNAFMIAHINGKNYSDLLWKA